MNAEWIREAADKAFPDHLVTVAGVTVVGVSRADERSAFIAGVAAGLAKAAEVAVGGFDPLAHCCEDCSVYSERWKIAAVIRALGSDEKGEGQ